MSRSHELSVSWSTKITLCFEREENQVHLARLLGKANSNHPSHLRRVHFVLAWCQFHGHRGIWQARQPSARVSLDFLLTAPRGRAVFPQHSGYTSDRRYTPHIALHCNYAFHACPTTRQHAFFKVRHFLPSLYPQVGLPVKIQDAQLKLNVK